jgi:16S rRNA (guanine966-N2)-methyltransferase
VRIIGGAFRSRRLTFPAVAGLRPTPDRVRETVFNWLGQRLDGLTCLDLFSGSGALGLEAASRGARQVVLVEQSLAAVAALRANAERLGAPVEVVPGDALAFLARPPQRFDVVFVDPPYAAALLTGTLAALRPWVDAHSRVYCEDLRAPTAEGYVALRQGRAGTVHFALLAPDSSACSALSTPARSTRSPAGTKIW